MVNSSNAKRAAAPGSENAASSSQSSANTLRLGVLGIGLVMEEVGKGARLVFRYPASPAPIFYHTSAANGNSGGVKSSTSFSPSSPHQTPHSSPSKKGASRLSSTSDSSSYDPAVRDNNSIDLFFDLPARILSKLFRPKRPLCGQPLTLNVSGTTFVCRAELFDAQPSTVGAGEGSDHPLVLFSVIVALAPLACLDGAAASANHFDRSSPITNNSNHTATQKRSDLAFNAIRRVHDNLATLCRVLKREELRCRYVSRQCNMLLQVRKEYESNPDNEKRGDDAIGSTKKVGSGMDGMTVKKANAVVSPASSAPPTPSSPKDKRSALPPPAPSVPAKPKESNSHDENIPKMSQSDRREYVQNLIEIMLAANCQNNQRIDNFDDDDEDDDDDSGDEHNQQLYGNLARELAQVYHCLSKDESTSNPSSLLGSKTEGRVYINRHISVPIVDITSAQRPLEDNDTEVHPYHTLLFPTLSPSEILKNLQDDKSETKPIRILRLVLPATHPRKSLNEIAFDIGVPLPHVMTAAIWLVESKLCVTATPVLRKNRYICVENVMTKIQSLQLGFWQEFGMCRQNKFDWGGGSPPHIFVVVSALTTKCFTHGTKLVSDPPTLGEAMQSGGVGNEDIVYSFAVWLIAQRVIVEMT
ncbi:hypothetical protein ACHAWC_011387 [Mediolabrus comicus]